MYTVKVKLLILFFSFPCVGGFSPVLEGKKNAVSEQQPFFFCLFGSLAIAQS